MTKVIGQEKLLAWRSFLEVHAGVIRLLEAELEKEAGLPLTWFDVLYQLSQSPDERLRMQDLAQKLLISRSGFTRLSDRMEEAGYIERTACPTDRRGIFIQMTPGGKAALGKATPVHLEGIGRYFADALDDKSAKGLLKALDRIRPVLKQDASSKQAPKEAT